MSVAVRCCYSDGARAHGDAANRSGAVGSGDRADIFVQWGCVISDIFDAALEVAQEAYVRLLSLDEPGAVSYLRSFLFKTAANLAVDRLRRDDVHARATETPLFREFADDRTPERAAVGVQEIQRLSELLTALPPKCREAFILSRLQGLEFPAIADRMKLSERMVRVYVVRALLYCRAHLERGA